MALIFNLLCVGVVSGLTVCIDPGHGGSSWGAVGEYALEKDVVLQVSLELQNWLCQVPGFSWVTLTRYGDYDVSLQARTDYANANGFDRFVSIHENAFNTTVQGTETYSASLEAGDPSFQLAALVQDGILDAYGYFDRGVKEGSWLHVIRETEMPAILGEGSFLDYNLAWNESYLYAYNIDDHIGVQSWAYASGICSHFGLQPPPYGNGVFVMDNLSGMFTVDDSLHWEEQLSGAPWMMNCMIGEASTGVWTKWESALPVYGSRVVQLWWTSGSDRSQSVQCRITHSGGSDDVFINQADAGEKWFELGTFSFQGVCAVELIGLGSAPGIISADAVRLVYPAGLVPETSVQISVQCNPSSFFIFTSVVESSINLEIFDLSGRLVENITGEGAVNWYPAQSSIPGGIYFAVDPVTLQSLKLLYME